MTIHTLGSENTVLSKFIAEIRDRRIHTDSMRFRRNMERIGEITAYELSSRYAVCDALIEELQRVEPLMYRLGEGGITGERISRTFVAALIGKIALHAAGWQTIRTDMEGLYGDVQFETKATDATHKCAYVRRTDYRDYLTIAETWFAKAMGEAAGSAKLVTVDERADVQNPFQRHFQYSLDLEVSPETLFEIGCPQGAGPDGMAANGEYLYAFGRGSSGGGSNGAPTKVFAATRMTPAFYFGGYANDDPRRDVSGVVTGLDGKGHEKLIPFKLTSKADGGGVCLNKWSYCYMSEPYTAKQRCAGVNYPVMRMAEVYLMLAEAKAALNAYRGKPTETADGDRVLLVANIGNPDDATGAIEHDAEGVGLFRSEFLFMDAKELPSEEDQFKAYQKVALKMKDQPVIIRTLDVGGDKEIPYLDLKKEENAVKEARKLNIPIVAVVDTNCDHDLVDNVIPGNDDAIRAIKLISSVMANAVQEGRQGVDAAPVPEKAEESAPAAE